MMSVSEYNSSNKKIASSLVLFGDPELGLTDIRSTSKYGYAENTETEFAYDEFGAIQREHLTTFDSNGNTLNYKYYTYRYGGAKKILERMTVYKYEYINYNTK